MNIASSCNTPRCHSTGAIAWAFGGDTIDRDLAWDRDIGARTLTPAAPDIVIDVGRVKGRRLD